MLRQSAALQRAQKWGEKTEARGLQLVQQQWGKQLLLQRVQGLRLKQQGVTLARPWLCCCHPLQGQGRPGPTMGVAEPREKGERLHQHHHQRHHQRHHHQLEKREQKKRQAQQQTWG